MLAPIITGELLHNLAEVSCYSLHESFVNMTQLATGLEKNVEGIGKVRVL